jgi:hypothetical protein
MSKAIALDDSRTKEAANVALINFIEVTSIS